MSDHDHIPTTIELAVFVAETFPQPPLNAIADHRIPDLLADREADSALRPAAREVQQQQVRLSKFAPATLNPPKITVLLKPHLRTPETLVIMGVHDRIPRWYTSTDTRSPHIQPKPAKRRPAQNPILLRSPTPQQNLIYNGQNGFRYRNVACF